MSGPGVPWIGKNLETYVAGLAARGWYQTPQGNYYSARLDYIKSGDPADLERMLRSVTETMPDMTELSRL